MLASLQDTLAHSHKFNYVKEFTYYQKSKVFKSVGSSDTGIGHFVRGLKLEFDSKDHFNALKAYLSGAQYLNEFCLFRLHDIYLGDKEFKISYLEEKSVCFLIWGALLSYREITMKSRFYFSKLFKILRLEGQVIKRILELVKDCEIECLKPTRGLIYLMLEDIIQNQASYMYYMPGMISEIPMLHINRIIFPVVNLVINSSITFGISNTEIATGETDLISVYMSHSEDPFACARKMLRRLLCPEIFSIYIEEILSWVSMLQACPAEAPEEIKKKIRSNLTFACHVAIIMRRTDFSTLIFPIVKAAVGNRSLLMNDDLEHNYLRFQLAYMYGKGFGIKQNLSEALDLMNSKVHPNLFELLYHVRRCLIKMKKLKGKQISEQELNMDIFENKENEKYPSYAQYCKGKFREKVLHDYEGAMKEYELGINSNNKKVSNHYAFFCVLWQFHCQKRLQKMICSMRLVTGPTSETFIGNGVSMDGTVIGSHIDNVVLSREHPTLIVYDPQSINYRKIISHSTNSAVYEASVRDHPITVKIFFNMSKATMSMILNKVEMVKTLDSPYLIKILGVAIEQNNLLLIMPSKLHDLKTLLELKKITKFKSQMLIAQQISAGVFSMHCGSFNPLIHGRLSTSNILLDENQNVSICDISTSNPMLFKPQIDIFLPPEVFSEGKTSLQSDIWGLGMTFYLLFFANKVPKYFEVIREDFKIESKYKTLNQLLVKMLNPNPKLRPDIEEVLSVLNMYK